jgi:Polyketide cyclase / dehydrase and lipid transport
MTSIVSSIEIACGPEAVFAYVTDPSRLTEWQEGMLSSRLEGGGPAAVGSKLITTRRVGRRERTMTMELTRLSPLSWGARGIDGPIRAIVDGNVEPLDEGARSRLTIELDFEGHGLGKLLVPLVVRRQAREEMPINLQNVKERVEGGG